MKLTDINKNWIRQFAGPVIFARGVDYYQTGRVIDLDFANDEHSILARVRGSYGHYYEVSITLEGMGIDAECDCPYEGYPCKHIVAALLTCAEMPFLIINKPEQLNLIKQHLTHCTKEQLITLILDQAKKQPNILWQLLLMFES